MILIKDENWQNRFLPLKLYYSFFTAFLNLFSTNPHNNQSLQQFVIKPPLK